MAPLDIGSTWQLFLDDAVIEIATGLDRRLHQPVKQGPVLSPDQPWERSLLFTWINRSLDGHWHAIYHVPWYDSRIRDVLPEDARDDKAHWFLREVAYAVSDDGIRWQKPALNSVDMPAAIGEDPFFPEPSGATRANNCGVPFDLCYDLGTYGNVSDPQRRFLIRLRESVGEPMEQQPFNKRYGALCFAPDFPDFINDRRWRDKLTPIDGGTLSPRGFSNLAGYDEQNSEWFGLMQGVTPRWLPARYLARWASPDFREWHAAAVLHADPNDPHTLERYDEPMEITVVRHENFWLGFVAIFHSDRTHPHYGNGHWWRKGTVDLQLVTSHDGGYTWHRVADRQTWLPHATEEDGFDRLAYVGRPLRVGDKMYFYYQAFDGDHLGFYHDKEMTPYYHDRVRHGCIALATQRWNGFVSLSAKSQPTTFVTKPLIFQGTSLYLNADATRGGIRVEIAPAEPQRLDDPWSPTTCEGFSRHDALPLRGNGVEQQVQWKSGDSVAALQGHPVRLRIELQNADLYGFRFA